MQTIILAAGDNERFDGNHKSALTAPDGRTILEHQAELFDADPLIFIAQRRYAKGLRRTLSTISYMRGKPRTVIHAWIDKPTLGPLDTLHRALDVMNWLHEDQPVAIAYCDVLPSKQCVDEFYMACSDEYSGTMIFESNDARFQDAEFPLHKLSGIFYFNRVDIMIDQVRLLPESQRGPDAGIAKIVMNTKNPRLFICDDIVDIGTPEAYKEWTK